MSAVADEQSHDPTMRALPEDWMLPEVTPFSRRWFTGGELAIQRCAACTARQHPPEEICRRCGSMAFDHEVLAPTGVIHSYTVVHHPVHGALAPAVPYAVVLVALDDAPDIRIVGNLVGVPRSAVAIGRAVEATWEPRVADAGPDVLLPQWRLR